MIKYFFKGFSIILTTFFIMFLISFFMLPSSICLINGEKENIKLNLPVSTNANNSVFTATKIENDAFNVDENFSLIPNSIGKSEMNLSLFGLLPIKTVSVSVLPNDVLIPCGNTVGISIETEGVMVLGLGYVNGYDGKVYEPTKGILKIGDVILKAGDITLQEKEDLVDAIEINGDNDISLIIKRGDDEKIVVATPVLSEDGKNYKLGVWVRDSTQGLGTMTFYNKTSNEFGALGHGIYDVDTKKIMSVKEGSLTDANISGIKKSSKGSPGEILGSLNKSEIFGDVVNNSKYGIYGNVSNDLNLPSEAMPITLKNDVEIGAATILTDILGGDVVAYDVNIESINKNSLNADKSIVINIVDEKLLSETNGIVQGM